MNTRESCRSAYPDPAIPRKYALGKVPWAAVVPNADTLVLALSPPPRHLHTSRDCCDNVLARIDIRLGMRGAIQPPVASAQAHRRRP